MNMEAETDSSFGSLFFPLHQGGAALIRVPDYQRAFSWGPKQIELFIADLERFQGGSRYYFGHFIVEEEEVGVWEVVDGQQRLTTFVLFLLVCRQMDPSGDHPAYRLIDRFRTVSYDVDGLTTISAKLPILLAELKLPTDRKLPSDEQIREILGLQGAFTRSQARMVHALLRIHGEFLRGGLAASKISNYLDLVMEAHCSLHLTRDKTVAVNIFEMHNTRGLPLTPLEIVKAKLMQHVHNHAGSARRAKVSEIQKEFGEIYAMEELVAETSFRGRMTMEQILRLHLRVVDDGTKRTADEFRKPALTAGADALVGYVDTALRFRDQAGEMPRDPDEGVDYALRLAREFKKSVRIVSFHLPEWDQVEELVGDVLILERELSCQFFLMICRLLEFQSGEADGRLSGDTLRLWERLLFTRDFHGNYYNLKGTRDNFEELYERCMAEKSRVPEILKAYLRDGFRPWDQTKDLQAIVTTFLEGNKKLILRSAYHWWRWRHKMQYVVYKYEVSQGSNIRSILKDSPSLEHILPQEWGWPWIEQEDFPPKPEGHPVGGRENALKQINTYVNGLGNLLLLSGSENASQGNRHPKFKQYLRHEGGSYAWHHANLDLWASSSKWFGLIMRRGLRMYRFMMETLILSDSSKFSDASNLPAADSSG